MAKRVSFLHGEDTGGKVVLREKLIRECQPAPNVDPPGAQNRPGLITA